MMVDIFLFLAGVQMGIWMIAGLYSLLDLHYAWRRYWRIIAVRIVSAFGLFLMFLWALGGAGQPLLYGAVTFASGYLITSVLLRVMVTLVYHYRRQNPD